MGLPTNFHSAFLCQTKYFIKASIKLKQALNSHITISGCNTWQVAFHLFFVKPVISRFDVTKPFLPTLSKIFQSFCVESDNNLHWWPCTHPNFDFLAIQNPAQYSIDRFIVFLLGTSSVPFRAQMRTKFITNYDCSYSLLYLEKYRISYADIIN